MAKLPVDNLLVSQLDIVAVIDGTGRINDENYKHDFKNSFCKQIKDICLTGIYRRGVPGEEDTTTFFNRVYASVRSAIVSFNGESSQNGLAMGNMVRQTGSAFDRPRPPRSPFGNPTAGYPNPLQQQIDLVDGLAQSSGIKNYRIFLVGYSRGGSECIFLANLLQRAGLAVDAMFLFDAVNMTVDLAGYRKIPSNVRVCYHAHRNPQFADAYWHAVQIATKKLQQTVFSPATNVANATPWLSGGALNPGASRAMIEAQSELALAQDRLDKTRSDRWTRFSLNNWGNVGLDVENQDRTSLVTSAFDCSHGAMGGLPWPASIFPRDFAESVKVHDWMWKRLQAHNVLPEAKVADPNMRFMA